MAGMYADYEYYARTDFGRDIAPEDWPRAARMADAFIDKLTFNRLRAGWEVTDAVRNACCAVADEMRAQEEYSHAARAAALGIRSENNDGYSASFSAYSETQASMNARLLEAAEMYLSPADPLRYAGIYHCSRKEQDNDKSH